MTIVISTPDVVAPMPWEKQSIETAKSFGAFKIYRDLKPSERSLRLTVIRLYGENHEHYAGKLRQMSTWSAQYQWVSRAAAWDEHLDQVEREAQVQAIKDMRTRHTKIGQLLQNKAIERLKGVTPDELTIGDILSFLAQGTNLERKSLGEPEEIVHVEATVGVINYSTMTDIELRKILATKIGSASFPQLTSGQEDE